MLAGIDEKENLARMQRGELYYAFSPGLVAARRRCSRIVRQLNRAGELSRRELAEYWKEITNDPNPLPLPLPAQNSSADEEEQEEDTLLHAYPWIERPINIDYGTNLKVGSGVFINFNCTFIDTCTITIGARTLIGPNVCFFSGTHPLDPDLRCGTQGPESGKPVTIGEDCWIAGNVVVLPGDVPPYHVVAGNPASIIRKIERGSMAKPHIGVENPGAEVEKDIPSSRS
ncbi:trimeric LpxA-like protein [Aspergillus carlsbadensis]|nr:trimeric LpxA-like protein [Aspergillus carlsbadensis]